MKLRLLNVEPDNYSPNARGILKSFALVDEKQVSRGELLKIIPQYDGLIVRLRHRIDCRILDRAIRLKFIATATTGLNHIDLARAKKLKIEVISLKGQRAFLDTVQATPEFSWALLLALTRKVTPAFLHVLQGRWERDLFRASELSGKTLGIVGLGRVGAKVARYGICFGMNVRAYDPHRTAFPKGITRVGLEELLRTSDIVMIHVSYDTSTHCLIGKGEFAMLKKGAYLVNTSRGEVIDEDGLVSSLKKGQLAGAALDVLCNENSVRAGWPGRSRLVQYARANDNLIITPHIAGATRESMEKTEIFIAEKIKERYGWACR